MINKKNGQSLTEFLFTYGWSFLIILIISVLIFSIFVDLNSLIPNSVELDNNFRVDPTQSLASEDDFVLITFQYIGIDKISISPNNKSIISNIKQSDIFSNCYLTWIKNIDTDISTPGNSQGDTISQGSSISSKVDFLNSHTGVIGFNCINIDLLKGDVLSGDISLVSTFTKTNVDFNNEGELVLVITETSNNLITNYTNNITNLNCEINSALINHSNSNIFYNSSSQPYESSCQSITRTCSNGVLSGDNSYIYSNCINYNSSFNCFDPINVGKIGKGKECSEMLIVDDIMLQFAASSVVGGDESFIIEYNNTNYSFDNSEFNIFTGQVTNMSNLFRGTSFNSDINYWNLSLVTNLSGMFYGASNFNQPLDNWNTNNVMDMGGLFYDAIHFNQPLNNWDVSNVRDMRGTFSGALSFNQALNNWNVSNVEHMGGMFLRAINFNQSLNNWEVYNVENMAGMFYGATILNQPLNYWNVGKVTNMSYMFYDAIHFNQNLSCWDVTFIPFKPLGFDIQSRFENVSSMKPKWGTNGC